MNKKEVVAIMTAIRAGYPSYYKNQTEINDAINLWTEMLSDDATEFIVKAVKEYIKNDDKGYPPSIGQIRTIAKEIRRSEWEKHQREIQSLPEPEIERVPMPDEIREMMDKVFKQI